MNEHQQRTNQIAACYWEYAKMVWPWGNYLGACVLAVEAFTWWMGWSRIGEWLSAAVVPHVVSRHEWEQIWEHLADNG